MSVFKKKKTKSLVIVLFAAMGLVGTQHTSMARPSKASKNISATRSARAIPRPKSRTPARHAAPRAKPSSRPVSKRSTPARRGPEKGPIRELQSAQSELRESIDSLRKEMEASKPALSSEQRQRLAVVKVELKKNRDSLEKLQLAIANGLDPDLVKDSLSSLGTAISTLEQEAHDIRSSQDLAARVGTMSETVSTLAQSVSALSLAVEKSSSSTPESSAMPTAGLNSFSSEPADTTGADPVVEPVSSMGDNFNFELLGSGVYLFDGYTTSQPYAGALGYPYTNSHGFLGNFFGGNFSYGEGNWGSTIDLRWGTAAPLLTPLAPLKQGYVTWKPQDTITLDLGFMDTIFGAEVADEWANVNFSRGALYFLRQPFNHMGLRVGIEASEKVGLNFLVTNGPTGALGLGGQPVDSDQVPSVAIQIAIAPDDTSGIALGFMTGPNGSDPNGNFGHFFDLVVTKSFGDVALVFNADVTIDPNAVPDETTLLFGGSFAASAAIGDKYSAGGRVEFLGGSGAGPGAGADDYIATITGTLRHMASDNLVLSIEPRVEFAGEDVYVNDDAELESVWYGLMFGASVHFGN